MSARRRLLRTALAALVAALAVPTGTLASNSVADRVGQAADVCVRASRVAARPEASYKAYGAAVVATNGRPRWIFGLTTVDEAPRRPLALRWTGRTWQNVEVPWRGRVSGLVGGDVEGSETWAVGFARHATLLHPIIGRWVDGRWHDVHVPPLPQRGTALVDIEALGSGEVIAVGTDYRRGRARAVAVQRVEGTWRAINPQTGSTESAFLAITEDAQRRPWAVGWQLRSGRPQPLLAMWTGTQWRMDQGAHPGTGSTVLTDIAFRSRDEAWAVGYQVMPGTGRHHAIALRWDGRTWSEAALPWARGRSMVPRAISFGDHGRVAIAGFLVARNRGREVGFVATRDGGGWTVDRVSGPGSRHWELMDVAAVGNGFVSVGGVSRVLVVRGDCGPEAVTWADPDQQRETTDVPVRHALGSRVEVSLTFGDIRIEDVAGSVGIASTTLTYGAVGGDFNQDGWPDLLIGRHGRRPLLMTGGPTGFRQLDLRFPERDYHGCAAGDVDADKALDVYCTVGAYHGAASKANALWLDPASGPLEPVSASMGVVDPFGRGRQATFLNLDGDRYPDLFVTNQPDRVDGLPSTDRMFRNLGGRRFVPAPEAGLDRSMGGSCATAADLDGDGDDELLVCASEALDGRPPGLRVFRNDGGRMREVSAELGIEPDGDGDALVADINGDDRLDIIRLSARSLWIHAGAATGFEAGYRVDVHDASAVAAGDVNADGRLDLYVAQGRKTSRNDVLLINRGGPVATFSRVVIPGTDGGRADDVVTIDHDQNGMDDFLVLNGADVPGPIQLIAAFPR